MNGKLLSLFLSAFQWMAAAADYPLHEERAAPNKQYVAVVDQPTRLISPVLTIRDNGGQIFLRLESEVMQFYPETVRWSPDSQIVAIAGGSHFLQEPFIFLHKGDRFVRIAIPYLAEGHNNAYIQPVRWLSGHRLILDISGPHAGHADYGFHGRTTIRILANPAGYETLYINITSRMYEKDS